MAPKDKHVDGYSSAAAAPTTVGGSPPQESPILCNKNGFAIVELKGALTL